MRQLSHNADSNLLREKSNCRGIFFLAKAAKTLMTVLTRTHPLITLANPLRSLCALCGFAREEQLSRDNFSRQAAKVAKEKHEYFCNDFPRLMLAIARLAQKYAIRVHSHPLAGRGPCDRTPLQDNQFPIRGANGHKGRALQMAGTTHKRPKGSLRGLILRSNNSVARLSPRLLKKKYIRRCETRLASQQGFQLLRACGTLVSICRVRLISYQSIYSNE